MSSPPHGSFYFTTPVETTLGEGVAVKALGTTTSLHLANFTMPTNNRLTYTYSVTHTFLVCVSVSITRASGGAPEVGLYIAENGTEHDDSEVYQISKSTGDTINIKTSHIVSLDQNDYVEIFIETDNGVDCTIEKGFMTVRTIG
jgi:hypothetical protein